MSKRKTYGQSKKKKRPNKRGGKKKPEFGDVVNEIQSGQTIHFDADTFAQDEKMVETLLQKGISDPVEYAKLILGYTAQAYSILKYKKEMSMDEEMLFVRETIENHEKYNAEQWRQIKNSLSVFCKLVLAKLTTKTTINRDDMKDIVMLLTCLATPLDTGKLDTEMRAKAAVNWFMSGFAQIEAPIYKGEMSITKN